MALIYFKITWNEAENIFSSLVHGNKTCLLQKFSFFVFFHLRIYTECKMTKGCLSKKRRKMRWNHRKCFIKNHRNGYRTLHTAQNLFRSFNNYSFNFNGGQVRAHCIKLFTRENSGYFLPEFFSYVKVNGRIMLTRVFSFYQSFSLVKSFMQ